MVVPTPQVSFSRRACAFSRSASSGLALAEREKAQARREKETCGVGTTTTIVQQVDGSKGSKYTKRDVEPVLQKARRKMNDKGMLPTDLPSPAQALEQEAVAAMKDGDYGKAKFAADELYATVDSMKIDKAFISAKIGRLNAAMKGKSLDGDRKKEADALFRGATSDYGDGRFPSANGKLNKIYALILASTRGPKALTPASPPGANPGGGPRARGCARLHRLGEERADG